MMIHFDIENDILIPLLEGKYVSRWDISLHYKEIKYYLKTDKYKHLQDDIDMIIDSCRESR